VRCQRREIRFHTEYRDQGEPYERTEVIFTGVACYDFERDSDLGTILFDIEEVRASDIYDAHGEQLRAGVRYGWPGCWAESAESAAAYFQEHGILGFQISSSCGMCGCVLAQHMQNVIRADPPAG